LFLLFGFVGYAKMIADERLEIVYWKLEVGSWKLEAGGENDEVKR